MAGPDQPDPRERCLTYSAKPNNIQGLEKASRAMHMALSRNADTLTTATLESCQHKVAVTHGTVNEDLVTHCALVLRSDCSDLAAGYIAQHYAGLSP